MATRLRSFGVCDKNLASDNSLLLTVLNYRRETHSSVSIVTIMENLRYILGKGGDFISSPPHPHRLWWSGGLFCNDNWSLPGPKLGLNCADLHPPDGLQPYHRPPPPHCTLAPSVVHFFGPRKSHVAGKLFVADVEYKTNCHPLPADMVQMLKCNYDYVVSAVRHLLLMCRTN
jgi:hypothetical protein